MPDPVSQIYMQAAGGSAEGQGFGQFAVEGRRLAQNQQQLNLSQRRLQFEEEQARAREPLLRLERQRMLQQMAVTSLEFQKTQSDNSYAISLRDSELQVSRFMSELAQNGAWGSPESWARWEEITNRVPLAAVSKAGQLFLQQQRLAMANQRLAKQFGAPTKVTVPTAEGGDATFGDAPRSVTADIQNQQEANRIRARIAAAPPGSPERAAAELELSEFNARSVPVRREQRTVVRPDGTVEIIDGPSSGAGATTATQTRVQQNLEDSRKAIEELRSLELTLRPKDVGAAGVFGEVVLDRVAPQLGLATADFERMDNRTKLKAISQSLLRQVSADNRFSNDDRKAVERIVPKAGVVESYENAIQTTRTLSRIFAKRALMDAQSVDAPPPAWALGVLDLSALIDAKRSGLITREQAIAEEQRRRDAEEGP